jgi:hypothetical protein
MRKTSKRHATLETSLRPFIVKWILPPGISKGLSGLRKSLLPSQQDNPLDQYRSEEWWPLLKALEGATAYLEFGSGLSTEFVSKHYDCRVRSIETSSDWVARVKERVRDDIQVLHIDLGPVGEWGRPLSYDHRQQFRRYFEAGFDGEFSPDAILIDGRFRVACFLTALLLSAPFTKIVIDDYPMRPVYHIVESILQPVSVSSRQALFERPEVLDENKVRLMRSQFTNVMD